MLKSLLSREYPQKDHGLRSRFDVAVTALIPSKPDAVKRQRRSSRIPASKKLESHCLAC